MRNYQVRNFLRDTVRKGDQGFFYHSSCDVPGIYGIVSVARAGYVEPGALDPEHRYHDPKSDPENPRWRIDPPITLETLRKHAHGTLCDMLILRRGNRLSVTPVTRDEWRFITALK